MTSELEGMWQGKSALSLVGHRLRLPVGGVSLFSLVDSSTPAGKNMETYAAVSVRRERERERERERSRVLCLIIDVCVGRLVLPALELLRCPAHCHTHF